MNHSRLGTVWWNSTIVLTLEPNPFPVREGEQENIGFKTSPFLKAREALKKGAGVVSILLGIPCDALE
ncbi:MAG: hypothetical protein IGS39_09435 [Calothrix sp. C42_A2020_038]|nr:hypothetical protein [Calothrix sp. C42_A2020_038]